MPENIICFIDTASGGNLSHHIYFYMEAIWHIDTFIMTHQNGKICHKIPKYIIFQRTAGISVPLSFAFLLVYLLLNFSNELIKGLEPVRERFLCLDERGGCVTIQSIQ